VKKRPRKPGPVYSPLLYLAPMPAAELAALELRLASAVQAMATYAEPGAQEWRDVADILSTVETLAYEMGKLVPAEVQPMLDEGTAGLAQAAERWKAGKRMGLSGPALQAMRDLLAVYVQCGRELTGRDMAKARDLTAKRYQQALAGKLRGREAVIV
jgi:hypothetical protein